MELPEIVEFARRFSVMIRINGPDPKGVKMRNHAFHQYHSGKTTLSASGMLLPQNLCNSVNPVDDGSSLNGAVVVTVASIVEPFLTQDSKRTNIQGVPKLIPGAQIDVMVEVKEGMEMNSAASDSAHNKWFGAQVLKLVDVPTSSAAIESLIEASSGSLEHNWEIGWSLAANIDNSQRCMDGMQGQEKNDMTSTTEAQQTLVGQRSTNTNLMAMVATRIAFLEVPKLLDKDLPEVMVSSFNNRGGDILSVGSPFGILSPMHFFNSISVGSVSNFYPPMALLKSILMADIRCLPGMEGGPIFDHRASLIGIFTRPLRQSGGAEIQVVIPWKAIEGACRNLLQSVPQTVERAVQSTRHIYRSSPEMQNCGSPPNCIQKHPASYCSQPLPVEQTMTSVCLITLHNGVWASGVLLNREGLILTNAHLLEPWRFGRQSTFDDTKMQNLFTLFGDSGPLRHAEAYTSGVLHPVDHLRKGRKSYQIQHVHRQINVRLDLMNSWVWCDAKIIYVSKGPLDISLLQLESIPHQLCPITVDLACPSPGSQAFVIGHGLLGPRCDMFPSVCSGVVAKVVKTKNLSTLHENSAEEIPVMLETTAAVHPGGSGGAVVNSSGRMIGLVTSNAKHGGGTVIPHMNFSIPSAALEPVFIFAKDMQDKSVLQELDKPDKELASVWAMMPPISPDPGPSLPNVDDFLGKDNKSKQVKGSQFAKFVNQRWDVFSKPSQLNTTDLPRDTIPSKL